MNEKFDLEKRLKAIELAKKDGIFTFRDDDVVNEAIKWFTTPFNDRKLQPKKGVVKRLIRILNRRLN
tara:strand:+ start:179 stop:379 length:201 start_codon:yes stop_codon:yes gene_type:complete